MAENGEGSMFRQRVVKTEGVRSTSGPTRVTTRGPGGRDIKLEQHLARVRAASVGAVQKGRKNKGHNAVKRTVLWYSLCMPLGMP